MAQFNHDGLDVYRLAVEFTIETDKIVKSLPQGRSYLADQLRRAAASIPLNIAEGAGEFSPGDKARFFRMARRSATECAAVLDVARGVAGLDAEAWKKKREMLLRIVAMLTKMVLRQEGERRGGSGTGTFTGTGTG